MGAAIMNNHDANKHGPKDEREQDDQRGVHEGKGMWGKRGGEIADDMHMQGKPTAPCPPANNICKQGNGKSCRQWWQHCCHPRCTLAAMPAVKAPPTIAPAPTPIVRTCHPHQTLHLTSDNNDEGEGDDNDNVCVPAPNPVIRTHHSHQTLYLTRHMQWRCCASCWHNVPWPLSLDSYPYCTTLWSSLPRQLMMCTLTWRGYKEPGGAQCTIGT